MKKIPFLLFLLPVMIMAKGVLVFSNADVFYPHGYEKTAVYIGNTFESIRDKAIDLVGNDPGRINIVLLDLGVNTNGVAFAFNHKTIHIYVWPTDAVLSTRLNVSNHYRQLLIHEFTHIAHLTYTTGVPAFISRVLLGTEMLSPQGLSPFVEGVTIFAESSIYPSEGRLNNPLWGPEMSYQNYLAKQFPELAYALAVFREDYRGGTLYYNYMANFYDYLVRRFGIEAIKTFHYEMSGRLPVLGTINSSKKAFGDTLDNLYEDWKEEVALATTKYATGSEIRLVENGQIFDMTSTDRGVIFSYARYGEASSWVGAIDRGIEEITSSGFNRRLSDFGALSLKWKDESTYLMNSVQERGRTTREIWQQSSPGSVKLLEKGDITAFDVYNGKLITALYDAKSETSSIFFGDMGVLSIPWLVKDFMVLDDGSYIMLLSRNGINGAIATFKEGEFQIILEDPYMKGRGIDFQDGVVIYTAAYEDGYMDAYAVDVATGEVFRLTRGANLEKAVVSGGKIYGFGHSREAKGMAVYLYDYSMERYSPAEIPADDFAPAEVEHHPGKYLNKAISHLLKPVLRAPLVDYDGKDFSLSFLTLHMSLDAKHLVTLRPSFNLGTMKPGFVGTYDGEILAGIGVSLELSLGIAGDPLLKAGISAELFQMPLNPSTRFRSYAYIEFDTAGDLVTGVPLDLRSNLFSLTLTPGIKLRAGNLNPLIELSAGFSPTLGTYAGIGAGFNEEFFWYAGASQVVYRINWGWSPLFFLKESGIGLQILGRNTTLETAAIYMFANLGSTIGIGDIFPKIGIQYSNDKFGVYLRLDTRPW